MFFRTAILFVFIVLCKSRKVSLPSLLFGPQLIIRSSLINMRFKKVGDYFMILHPGCGEVLFFPNFSISIVVSVVQDP